MAHRPLHVSSTRTTYQPIALEVEDGPLPHDYRHQPHQQRHRQQLQQSLQQQQQQQQQQPPPQQPSSLLLLRTSFWMLGLFNNASYVIMIASAKTISEGGTALVFLANSLPSLAIKLSAPYWFHRVTYLGRIKAATIFMTISLSLVAVTCTPTTTSDSSATGDTPPIMPLILQLLGVAFASAQCGLGEASLLALAGKVDATTTSTCSTTSTSTTTNMAQTGTSGGHCLTAFSSGTGMAGVFGFFWKWLWNDYWDFSLSTTLWLALFLVASGYWCCFQYVHNTRNVYHNHHHDHPPPPHDHHDHHYRSGIAVDDEHDYDHDVAEERRSAANQQQQEAFENHPEDEGVLVRDAAVPLSGLEGRDNPAVVVPAIRDLTPLQRFWLVLTLWPYMIPLFAVYAAEYALQSGTWTAIGFPLDSVSARDQFYEFSNWMYQVGVFLSRSSGTLFTAPLWTLWLMPCLQCANLGLFSYVASHPTTPFYQPAILYAGAFYTGILGGAVYIHGYKRICLDIHPIDHREFSLSATSVAEGFGVLVADSIGLVIQACLYQVNGLDGALVSCPATT